MPVEIIIGEIDGELLGIGDIRGNLHGKIRIVHAGIHLVGVFVQDLGDLGGVFLTDTKHQAFADFVRNGSRSAFSRKVRQKMRLVFSE